MVKRTLLQITLPVLVLTTFTAAVFIAGQLAAQEEAPGPTTVAQNTAPRRQPGTPSAPRTADPGKSKAQPAAAPAKQPAAPVQAPDGIPAAPVKAAPTESQPAPSQAQPPPAQENVKESTKQEPVVEELRLPPPPPDRLRPTPIELTVYRVQIPVVFQPDPLMGPAFREDILRELARIADTNVGPMWDVSITEADWITPLSRAGIERLDGESIKRRIEEEQVVEVIRKQFVTETLDRHLREELVVEVIRESLVNETLAERLNEPEPEVPVPPEKVRDTIESQFSIRGDGSLSAELRRQIRVMLDTDNTKQKKDEAGERPLTAQEKLVPDVVAAIAVSRASAEVLAEVNERIADIGIEALVGDARRVYLNGLGLTDVLPAKLIAATENQFAAGRDQPLSDDLRSRIRTMLDTEDDATQEELIGELVTEIATGRAPAGVLVAVREILYFYLIPPILEVDKMYPVSVERQGSEYVVSSREWDRESEFISPVQSHSTINRGAIANGISRLLQRLFRPVVQIESADQAAKTARVRYKSAEYPPADPGFRLIEPGSMFVPFFRYLDRKRVVQRIQSLPWTYITAESLARIRAECRVETGVGTPLGAFRARRMELRAIALRPQLPQTTLTLVPKRDGSQRPLVGYLVAVYDEPPRPTPKPGTTPKEADDSSEPPPERPKPDIYRSDRNGQVTIPVDPNKALQWVLIRSGGSLLTKFPFVAGTEQSMLAECPDDTIRLNVEGQITLLTGRLIDTIAKRAMVMAMIKNRRKKSQWKKVEVSLKELDELETYERFKKRVGSIQFAAIERAKARGDRRSVGRIKKLGSSVLKVARVHLDKAVVDDFRAETEELRRQDGDSAAALANDKDDNDSTGNVPPPGGTRAPGGGRSPGQ